uniref:Uncharacterized protein n=1 Tax=Ditylenchus dipsaci TaxID=166011 RepID=A0A915EL16_9BILA
MSAVMKSFQTYYFQLKALVDKSLSVPFHPHRKLDERLRWGNKDILDRGTEHESGPWFVDSSNAPSHLNQCLFSLISKQCSMPSDCIQKFLTSKGLIGYDISRQVLFVSLAQMAGCNDAIEKMIKENSENMSIDGFISERCTNIHDEMVRRDKKKLARIANPSLDLMMEQVFVCLQYGYLEFANPHSLVTALAWQHPVLGCYTLQKPESIPNLGLSSGLKIVSDNQSDQQGTCLLHTSTVVGLGIVMFLRFLLDPGPWPELRFVDQLVQIDQIVAEDHFEHFKYIDWVRDSNFPHEIRGMPRPPPMAWSPDLVAFMVLLFFCIIGSVIGHHLFTNNKNYGRMGGKVKQMYPYAFKKL